MKRKLRYGVAVSLDGFIAGPRGEYDWIVQDSSIDFEAMYKQFDTVVMGRKTYETMLAQGGDGSIPGLDVIVFSRTMAPVTRPGIRVVNDDPGKTVAELKSRPGGDIWLFGGGDLCRSLLDAKLVDTIEIAVIPVVLTAGVPLVAPGSQAKLLLTDHRVLKSTGIVVLSYALSTSGGRAPRITYVKSHKKRRRAPAKKVERSRAARSSRRSR
ncbi:MAG: dihydrofolate reductase family protein [Acidobacteriota bacterium]